ncbi:glycoside hydrolase family 3 protein [Candidatus Parcubacteria bacterium]|nr:glycoside hydrolase family 3 protein [Candidatus Parcubacteria bacterium]
MFVYLSVNQFPPYSDRYRDSSLPTAERVEDLLAQMTLQEKIGQMALIEKNSISETDDIRAYGLGALLSGGGGNPENNTVAGWQTMVNGFTDISRTSRLGIPILYGVDANHGHGNIPGATIFPHFIGLGATGDVDLVERVARATAEELVATNISWSFSPTLDMPQDIRWGRVYETFSDDPALVGRLGAAYVRGLQNNAPKNTGTPSVLATLKHYVGAGGMQWGTSSNEDFSIDQGATPADIALLHDLYLPPFQESIQSGALSVMVGLNSWGDTKIAASSYLIQDVLKGELGFKGFVVSDWYGVYEISGNTYADTVTAVNAGVDMVMLPYNYKTFVRNVATAVQTGAISESRIDDAVRRILSAKFKLGLFDEIQNQVPTETVGSDEHHQLAREAVAKSFVLLKNDENLLPLSPTTQSIFVAGSAADNVGRQAGAWTVEWQGVDGNVIPNGVSILAGIQNAAGGNADITFNENGVFSPELGMADVGIAVVGEKPYAEGWGDTAEPTLSQEDRETIQNLSKVSKKVVVILVTGRPLVITDDIQNWDALGVAWLPGSAGEGIADVLFGTAKITGALPLPWPASIQQLPIATDGSTRDGSPVLFERYFGLKR